MELKTPLYDCHIEEKGKIVPFAGYLLPVQFPTGVIAEHNSVRTKAGLFDVSHMGEILFTGEDALANLNYIFTNDFTSMQVGQCRYSPLCNLEGGCVDDLIIYKISETSYLAVVNAANRHKDVEWIKQFLSGDVKMEDISDSVAQIALQGPESKNILSKISKDGDLPDKYYTFKKDIIIGDKYKCLVSRTGYTGEFGYEIYCAAEDAPGLWKLLLETGKENGLIPCGLGARDTLRFEAAMPLYGHEMDETISPLETNLSFAVKMKKEDFVGKKGLEQRGPLTRKRVGLKVTGRGIIREQMSVFVDGKQIGMTTSGTHCPYLGYAAAMAILQIEYTEIGTLIDVEVRGRMVSAEVVELPFYKKPQ